ncbi:DNA polymerase III subunit delta [Chlamydia psittaci]|uniref:DNA polymerase III subunit delta n=1 Tax=Chlamydia psittaci TaxID=83554 RepID=UPI00027E1A0A|nr:DNA polymerase III subunit delta [Chlamydia psittaci]AFS25011.1 DNA polymerase III, delta subunit [Chlamydia psittaci M56]
MQDYTCFQDFSKFYKEKAPHLTVIGSNYEEDRRVCVELLIPGKAQEVDALGLTISDLSKWTESYGLFASKEFVSVFQAEKLSQQTRDFLARYARNPHPHLTLMLFTTKQSFFQSLRKELPSAVFLSLFGEWQSDVEKRMAILLSQKASLLGISCSLALASVFIKKFPQAEMHNLLGEFHKLLCCLGEKQVLEYNDIENFVVKQEQVSLWKLRDTVLQRNTSASQAMLQALLHEHGEEPLGLIAFLRGQCLYGLRSLEEETEDRKHRFFIAYGKERLYQALSYLFYAESIIKNNTQDSIIAMETLLIRMTST